MIEIIKANRCTCWCGHVWISESIPKRCAGKGKHRDWNSRDPRPTLKPTSKSVLISDLELEMDPFEEPQAPRVDKIISKPQSSGSRIAEDLLSQMASKLGRPSHALNCTCYTCKPPKAVK